MVRDKEAVLVDEYHREYALDAVLRKRNNFRIATIGAFLVLIIGTYIDLNSRGGGFTLFVLFIGMPFSYGLIFYWARWGKALKQLRGYQAKLDRDIALRRQEVREMTTETQAMAETANPVTPTTTGLSELEKLGLTGKRPT